MYIYRALSGEDVDSINAKKGIIARRTSEYNILQEIGPHIAKASSIEQKDCWISACKMFEVCVREYAIPQGGKYNTANSRKDVAVIDVSFWKKVNAISDCYSVFKSGNNTIVDFSNIRELSNVYGRTIWEKRYNQIKRIRKVIEDVYCGKIDSALFDCSFVRKKNAELDKLDLMSFSKERKNVNGAYTCYGLFDFGITAVQNGVAYAAKEVLCLNYIPMNVIKIVLTPIQQDIIYMLESEIKLAIIDELVNGNLEILWNEKKKQVEVDINSVKACIKGEAWMYPRMIYEFLDGSEENIEEEYVNYLDKKEDLLKQVINFINRNSCHGIQKIGHIPERDGLKVFDFDSDKYHKHEISKRTWYDVVAVKWNGKLYRVHDSNWTIGNIQKNNGLINDLIKSGKISSPF